MAAPVRNRVGAEYTYSRGADGKPRSTRRSTVGQDIAESAKRAVNLLVPAPTRRPNTVEESVEGRSRTRKYY